MKGISRMFKALPALILFLIFAFIGQAAAQSWTQSAPTGGPPVARMLHTAVYDQTNNRMIMFGGFTGDPDSGFCTSGNTSCRNDVWVLQNADGLGGTPTWTQLSPTGGLPNPRHSHIAVLNTAINRMAIYAGASSNGFPLDDVWVLTDATGTSSPALGTLTVTTPPVSGPIFADGTLMGTGSISIQLPGLPPVPWTPRKASGYPEAGGDAWVISVARTQESSRSKPSASSPRKDFAWPRQPGTSGSTRRC